MCGVMDAKCLRFHDLPLMLVLSQVALVLMLQLCWLPLGHGLLLSVVQILPLGPIA